MDIPKFLKISKIIDEVENIKTFYFYYELNSQPGQFVMLWIPGIDQKPFSIAYDDGRKFGLTIFKRGPLTEKLFAMKVGDRVGITGPYGTSFSLKPNTHYIMVAGGYGAAPLGYLAEKLISGGSLSSIDFLMGARGAEHLLFERRLTKIPNLKLHVATDDGSKGHKGFVTDLLAPLISGISEKKLVVTCGPELMEKKVLDICNQYNVNCEVSIERYMKCGYGVCGQCAVDPIGICICTRGPVVNRELANQITEFGKYHRDKSGKIVYFK
jgi:dihydroorotate dehydrogenase electron transfer subunit